ncbi:MAG: hypothetical protein IJ726_08870, partial [Phocaeicola sp.]|nr:hypothetical protein [Phocaeicola sp.]
MAAKAPDSPYSVTSPKRESTTKFKATWKRAGTANSGDKAYSKQIANWNVSTSRLQNGKWTKDAKDTTIGRPSIDKSATQHTAIINRNEYFPVKNVRLLSLHFAVQGVNDKGDAFSPWSHLTFKVPKAPSCTFDYDSGTGELKINMTIPSDNVADRYDCVYKVTRKDKKTTSSRYKDGKAHLALNQAGKAIKGTTKKSKLTVKTEVETVALGDGSSITFTVTMTARGFAGSTTTTKTFTIASPLRAHIRNVDLGNYDLISIVKNLNKGAFNKGLVRVFYRSDEGKPNAAYDTENPNEYILQRLVSPYECDTAAKANLQSGWVDVDTNAGSTSESASKYKKRVKLYSDPKLQKSDKVQYWTCTEYEAVSSGSIQEERVVGTKTVAAWKVAAMKKKKISVNGKSYSRYRNWTKASKKKVYFYKAYDKKTKQWIKNVAPWNLATKKATKYTVNGKEVKRYKSWAKDGAARNVKYYTCVNQKTGKTVKNIPAWSLDGYQNKTYTPINNPADGVMGEPIIDVLADMGFTPSGSVYDKRVWYRVKTTRFGISEYSEAYQAKALSASKPTASKDYAGFMRIIQNPLESGTSIIGTVGWNNKKNTDEGVDNPLWQSAVWTTLILWSQHKNALRSNEQPSSFPIDWKNSSKHHALRQKEYAQAVADGTFGTNISGYSARDPVPWKKSANFTIYGLEPGVPVYLWTRRHMVLDSYDEDGPVSSAPTEPKGFFPFTPIDNPTSVAVYLPEYYIVGDDLTVSWGHNAVCPQKSYNIYIVPAEPGYAKKHYAPGKTNVAKMPKKLLVAGTGTNNSVTIPGSVIERQLGNKGCVFYKNVEVDGVTSKHKVAFSVIRKLGIVVGVSTGGEEIY